jgi:hypothetical protein
MTNSAQKNHAFMYHDRRYSRNVHHDRSCNAYDVHHDRSYNAMIQMPCLLQVLPMCMEEICIRKMSFIMFLGK